MFDKQIYVNRRLNLRKRIKSGLVVILGNTESPMNYHSNGYKFRQDSNFLYFFGLDLPNLVGVIDIEDGKDSLYGDDFDIDDIIWMGPQPSVRSKADSTGVEHSAPYGAVGNAVTLACKSHLRNGRPIVLAVSTNDALAGNTCGFKSTSCADQLCRLLRKARDSAQE